MPEVLVRNLDAAVVEQLKARDGRRDTLQLARERPSGTTHSHTPRATAWNLNSRFAYGVAATVTGPRPPIYLGRRCVAKTCGQNMR